MALISLKDVTLAFGGPLIFDRLSLQLEKGERVALLGRNGTGKTTLMKILSDELRPTEGDVVFQKGLRTAYLAQEVPANLSGTVFDVVLSGLGERIKILSEYHRVSHALETRYSEALMRELSRLEAEMERTGGWAIHREVEQVVSKMRLDPEKPFIELSGGQKRRTLLARALVIEPDVLLLDEPTNHLDIDTIGWLEGFLKDFKGTILFVTHDRVFMQGLATRIMELDRGRLLSWACDYATFLQRKQAALEEEAAEQARFDKKLAAEEVWIRQGIKARRTRNEGRVRALEVMREKKRAQRQVIGQVKMQAGAAERSGQLVVKVEHAGYDYGELCLIKDFSTDILRGDKIGVIGPNGSGKTTLLRLLTGQLAPRRGTVKLGTNLEIAYYDQLREQLDEEKSVMENVCESGDHVTVNGRSRHVLGYLQDFLFSPSRARTPVKVLSGGERNRLFLARLLTRPSNFLVMDEPTNDVDIETLELLEELLVDYKGTLLLVSHDRAFLNNVVTSTIALEGRGTVYEYPGGYDDWLIQRRTKPDGEARRDRKKVAPAQSRAPKTDSRLTIQEKRELEKLPAQIEKLEAEQTSIYETLAEPDFYQKDPKEIAEIKSALKTVAEKLTALYERWEYLEGA